MDVLSFVFILLVLPEFCTAEQFLNSVGGEVGGGNYTYYSLTYEGPITLYLYSKIGDCDLYVSQTSKKPTFDPDTYCLQSSTCGLDTVEIPKNFLRPIRIGVYGHPSHELSVYNLEVFYREEEEDTPDFFAELQIEDEEVSDEVVEESEFTQQERKKRLENHEKLDDADGYQKKGKREKDGESFIWTLVFSLLDLFLEVIFL